MKVPKDKQVHKCQNCRNSSKCGKDVSIKEEIDKARMCGHPRHKPTKKVMNKRRHIINIWRSQKRPVGGGYDKYGW